MKDIAIYGAGGFGREVACLINSINRIEPTWNLIGFFDDGKELGTNNEYGKIIGGIRELNSYSKPLSLVISIGNPKIIMSITNKIENRFVVFPNIIAPNVLFLDSDSLQIGIGNIITFNCSISCNVKIGNFNALNIGVTIGHDTIIDSYNVFNPSVNISGEVCIGNNNFFGVSSIVLQQKKIGQNTTIGVSSVIIKNTKNDSVYHGNPACKLNF